MTEGEKPDNSNENAPRRKLLRRLGIGGAMIALPETWVTPVIRTVSTPAHAFVSETTDS